MSRHVVTRRLPIARGLAGPSLVHKTGACTPALPRLHACTATPARQHCHACTPALPRWHATPPHPTAISRGPPASQGETRAAKDQVPRMSFGSAVVVDSDIGEVADARKLLSAALVGVLTFVVKTRLEAQTESEQAYKPKAAFDLGRTIWVD
ncbi:hypothetical protein GGX14DRAFT_568370 [Mycena pura]|uniref:Uncharacterized protein n=1 Tax=Mycena pura TaxID=153505 RepID=A0AAD6V9M5_9AGAR|nr:hypothetical protein GGX14DRAFT_568370 [Mycena pura]